MYPLVRQPEQPGEVTSGAAARQPERLSGQPARPFLVPLRGFPGRPYVLYEAVRSSLLESVPGFVLGHVSHVYPTGASLYFTIVCAQGPDPVSQWQQAKQAVNAAILGAGGTISHHHGVGTDHAAGLAEEIGPLMLDTLRSVKRQLDPAGILNPGILLARDSG
ncbi:MAG: hypothetical protein AUG44_14925 [Actinobacteria bacterium 13_1_20CM_3_71_11]|nr:MAG: hypothetical protein AUG44_14925 [Actinobacteria bacterium 13_1_20CM_3_71_11]